jgi:hypothetical protein
VRRLSTSSVVRLDVAPLRTHQYTQRRHHVCVRVIECARQAQHVALHTHVYRSSSHTRTDKRLHSLRRAPSCTHDSALAHTHTRHTHAYDASSTQHAHLTVRRRRRPLVLAATSRALPSCSPASAALRHATTPTTHSIRSTIQHQRTPSRRRARISRQRVDSETLKRVTRRRQQMCATRRRACLRVG